MKERSTGLPPSLEQSGKMKRLLGSFGGGLKQLFVSSAEWVVKKAKNLLHLVHYWLIKMRKSTQTDEAVRDMQAKEELLREEERTLEKVIHEDLPQSLEVSVTHSHLERTTQEDQPIINEQPPTAAPVEPPLEYDQYPAQEPTEQQKTQKIQEFFDTEQPDEETQPKPSFFSRFFSKRKDATVDEEPEQHQEPRPLLSSDEFADGIVRIEHHPTTPIEDENRLMKEVVKVKRRTEEIDLDDELGVDRQILEKKIIQKITKNPKDAENYRQLGELYIKMKNYFDAEESYKQILRLYPRDIDAKRKLEKIKLLRRING